jgi:hypothetical protein
VVASEIPSETRDRYSAKGLGNYPSSLQVRPKSILKP